MKKRVISRYPYDIRDWWQKTKEDVKWAEHDLAGGFYNQVCFISQQIMEKALKTFLLANNVVVEKIHKLPVLLAQAIELDRSFSCLIDNAKDLDRYYLETRYPPSFGEKGGYTEKEAQEALRLAKKAVEFTKKKLPL